MLFSGSLGKFGVYIGQEGKNSLKRGAGMARYPFLALVFALISTSSAFATVVVDMDFNEQARRADLVVIATPLEKTGIEWKKYPHTLLKMKVQEFIAGDSTRQTIYLLEPGTESFHVVGAVHLETGRTYLLMLEAVSGRTYRLTGFNRGYYPLLVEKTTGKKVISHKPAPGGPPGMTLDAARKRIIAVRKNASAEGGIK